MSEEEEKKSARDPLATSTSLSSSGEGGVSDKADVELQLPADIRADCTTTPESLAPEN